MFMKFNKVFGIGLNKTGTNSLNLALNILGVKSMHYPHDLQTYKELISCNYKLSILKEYDAITDLPSALYFNHYDEVYPNSKFILTTRERSSWIKSVRNQWSSNIFIEPFFESDYKKVAMFFISSMYGSYYFSEQRFAYCYDKHIESVLDYFKDKKDSLLLLDVCNKLCPFLELENPLISFPWENKTNYKKLT